MRKFSFILILCLSTVLAKAQVPEDGYTPAGPSNQNFIMGSKFTLYDVENNFVPGVAGVFSYVLYEKGENQSFSVGTNLGLAASFSNIGSLVHIDAPVLLQANFGAGSTKFSHIPVGVVVSAGLGNNFLHFFSHNEFSYGPMIDLGVRLEVFQKIYQISGSYMQNLNQDRLYMGPSIVNIGFGAIF